MSTIAKVNPIEQRIETLHQQWEELAAAPTGRVLRWIANPDDSRMIDVFLELQNEEVGEAPDLFIRLAPPFERGDRYTIDVLNDLLAQYDDIREGIRGEGIPADWHCPAVARGRGGLVQGLVQACASLCDYYPDLFRHLVLVLAPEVIADAAGWRSWLGSWMAECDHPRIRVLVIESSQAPLLEALADAHPQWLITQRTELKMPEAYAQLVRETPGQGPGHEFRQWFVALSNAAASGDLAAASRAGGMAARVAEAQGWTALLATAHLALGGAYMAGGQHRAALDAYALAERSLGDAPADANEAKLAIQTRFAQAATLFAAGEIGQAATLYERIAPQAEAADDAFLTLEALRMGQHCRLNEGKLEQAWQLGQRAIEVGAKLEPDARLDSTLPYAAADLMRVCERVHPEARPEWESRLKTLLGDGWRKRLMEQESRS